MSTLGTLQTAAADIII